MAERPAFPMGRFTTRFLMAFALLLAAFYEAGPLFARLLLPAMEAEMRFLRPGYRIALSMAEESRIQYQVDIPVAWTDASGKRQDGIVKTGRLPAANASIHPILILSVLLAWPTVPWGKKWILIALSLPILFLVELLDLPLHILWKAESGLPLEGLSAGIIQFWGHVLNNGGKQFLSLAAVLLSLGGYAALIGKEKGEAGKGRPGRNDPCPCGSGKKFKNCCKE